jgi:5'-nucleotidase
MLGVPSIAVSLASMQMEYDDFQFTASFVSSLLDRLKDFKFPPKSILNVNVPLLHKEDIAGIAITELGRKMFTDDYEKRIDPRGKVYYWMAGKLIKEPSGANTDIAAVINNKISITPVTYEMTRKETMSDLNKVLCTKDFCNWH